MAAGIFVSYRRSDTRHVAGRLAGDLADRFGQEAIFRDVESIAGGDEFPVQLERALDQCAVMLVLIGPGWLDAADDQQRRRLDQPHDWVRLEIAAALRRKVRVMPVLVEDAKLPDPEQLPPELKKLTDRQAQFLSDARWRGDLQALVDTLSKVPGVPAVRGPAPPAVPPAAAKPGKRLALWGSAVVLLVILVGYGSGWFDSPADAAPAGPAVEASALVEAPAAGPAGPPDLSGMWISDVEEKIRLVPDGSEYKVEVELNGKRIGTGTARLNGSKLTMVTTEQERKSEKPDTYFCELMMADEYARFTGQCVSDGVKMPFTLKR